jgi:hypothetical protein
MLCRCAYALITASKCVGSVSGGMPGATAGSAAVVLRGAAVLAQGGADCVYVCVCVCLCACVCLYVYVCRWHAAPGAHLRHAQCHHLVTHGPCVCVCACLCVSGQVSGTHRARSHNSARDRWLGRGGQARASTPGGTRGWPPVARAPASGCSTALAPAAAADTPKASAPAWRRWWGWSKREKERDIVHESTCIGHGGVCARLRVNECLFI